jgi:hypothetical protein
VELRISARIVYCFGRMSEIIAAGLCLTLAVSLVVQAEHRFVVQQPLATIEEQYATSWSVDQPAPDALTRPESVIISWR